MKNSNEIAHPTESHDTFDYLLKAIANAVVDRLEHRQTECRRVLDMERTCKYLGVSEDTIYRLIASKKLTPVGIDSRMRFDIRDLDDLINLAKKRNAV